MGSTTSLTRRQLLSTLALTGTSAVAGMRAVLSAQGSASILRARTFNHVTFAVSDLQRATEWYQHMFGLSALRSLEDQAYALDFNDRFMRIMVKPKGATISQFCIGVDAFQSNRDAAKIRAAGIEVVATSPDYVDVRDPDGVIVRIAETKYNGACAKCPAPPAAAKGPAKGTPTFSARTINHVNFRVKSLKQSVDFYRKLFGTPSTLRPILPPGSKIYALDFNECYLSIAEATGPNQQLGVITHFCIGVEDFDLKRDDARLKAAGMATRGLAGAEGVPQATLYVNDPDGLNVQIAGAQWKSLCPSCDPAPVV